MCVKTEPGAHRVSQYTAVYRAHTGWHPPRPPGKGAPPSSAAGGTGARKSLADSPAGTPDSSSQHHSYVGRDRRITSVLIKHSDPQTQTR